MSLFGKKKKAADPPAEQAAASPLELVPKPSEAKAPAAEVPGFKPPKFSVDLTTTEPELTVVLEPKPAPEPMPVRESKAAPKSKAEPAESPEDSDPPPAPMPVGLQPQILPARAFRVPISPLHRLNFTPADPILKGRESARLSNISTSGIGLVAPDFIRPPVVGEVIGGQLLFETGSFPVQLEVVHVTSGVIGARFEGDPKGLRDAIKAYFELELLALGMLKVNPTHHKAEPDGNAHWIHGDQCELFYVTDGGGKVLRFRLTFTGNRFAWSKSGGLSVGQVVDDRVGIMRTDRIASTEATPEIIDFAIRFLQNIPQVPQEHRRQIGEAISPGRNIELKV